MSDAHRTRGFIPWTKVDARLRAMREIWVATASPNGRPDAVPVWFWWDGASVYFTTKADSRKAANIARRPSVVLHNGDGADPIILKGLAEPVTEQDELLRVDSAYAVKYVDPGSGERATVFVEGDIAFRVRPRIVSTWEYATCSNRTDWQFEAPVRAGREDGWRKLRRMATIDLERLVRASDDFRRELATAEHSQIVAMTIPVDEEIGEEVHEGIDQLLVLVDGSAEAVLEGESSEVHAGQAVLVPAGTRHNFVNRGDRPLLLWTVYAPPEHPPGTVHHTKADAQAAEHAH